MNHHKWLQQQIEKWEAEGLVDSNMARSLRTRYPLASFDAAGLMMFLAVLLLGIGVIFFIADNWNSMPDLLKLIVLIGGMILIYAIGDRMQTKHKSKIGLPLIFLGSLMFGASIFLIGQMFNIAAYNAGALLVWSLVTGLLGWLYKNPYIILASVIQWALSTWFQGQTYSQNPLLFFLMVVPFAWTAVQWKSRKILLLLLTGLVPGVISALAYFDASPLWANPILLLVFAAAVQFGRSSFPAMFQYPLLTTFYVAVLLQLLLFPRGFMQIPNSTTAYIVFALIFLLLSVDLWRKKLIYLLPLALLFLPTGAVEYVHVINAALAIGCSVYLISLGEREKEPLWINHGTILFLLSIFFIYVRNAWSLLNSSLFFVIGGIVLFAAAIFTERRRRRLLSAIKEVE